LRVASRFSQVLPPIQAAARPLVGLHLLYLVIVFSLGQGTIFVLLMGIGGTIAAADLALPPAKSSRYSGSPHA